MSIRYIKKYFDNEKLLNDAKEFFIGKFVRSENDTMETILTVNDASFEYGNNESYPRDVLIDCCLSDKTIYQLELDVETIKGSKNWSGFINDMNDCDFGVVYAIVDQK